MRRKLLLLTGTEPEVARRKTRGVASWLSWDGGRKRTVPFNAFLHSGGTVTYRDPGGFYSDSQAGCKFEPLMRYKKLLPGRYGSLKMNCDWKSSAVYW